MKRIIIIIVYLVGVVVSWFMGMNFINDVNEKYNLETTYGEMAMVTFLSIFSWLHAIGVVIAEIITMDFWNKPIW